ncbi:hypothetical protein [Phaeobacter inhibens]|uniref:hypothetical protein n=1 Tax=Phaeobacter inhibens TaxID=221822 RepID=UPI0021A93290|nr:hypothetical protein [Phaeobacter inhibens]UWS08282.1 hypothetical protein K4K98_00940 [Phaeobacter inhibens]
MQKTLITAATVFALVLSAGASMAGPLNGHSFGGKAHDVRSSVSQAFGDQTSNMSDRNFDLSSKQAPGGTNLATSQQIGLYGSNATEYTLNISVDTNALKVLNDVGDDLWVFPSVKSSEESKIIPVE